MSYKNSALFLLIFVIKIFFISNAYSKAKDIPGLIKETLEEKPIAIATAVIENGEIKECYVNGVYNTKKNKSINSEKSLFHLSALSEQVTAIATLKLISEGKLSFNEKLTDIIPNLDNKLSSITIENLLLSESGIPDISLEKLSDSLGIIDDNTMLSFLKEGTNIKISQPGRIIINNDFNAFLLSRIIEKKSGVTFENYVEGMFKGLGLKYSCVRTDGGKVKNRIENYTKTPNGFEVDEYQNKLLFSGSRNIYMSINEYASLIAAFDKNEIFPQQFVDDCFRMRFKPGKAKFSGYGWHLVFNSKQQVAYKSGADMGSTNVILRSVRERITVVILSNQSGLFKTRMLAYEIMKLYSKIDFIPE